MNIITNEFKELESVIGCTPRGKKLGLKVAFAYGASYSIRGDVIIIGRQISDSSIEKLYRELMDDDLYHHHIVVMKCVASAASFGCIWHWIFTMGASLDGDLLTVMGLLFTCLIGLGIAEARQYQRRKKKKVIDFEKDEGFLSFKQAIKCAPSQFKT